LLSSVSIMAATATSMTSSALPSQSAAEAAAKLATAADAEAEAYESTHVHGVYEAIASHFSATRYKPWPAVASFLRALPPGAVGFDVGCGNGKYLGVNPDVVMIGSDRSPSLIALANSRAKQIQSIHPNPNPQNSVSRMGGETTNSPSNSIPAVGTDVLVADGLLLPFRERSADFIICVAVIHHMSTRARRQEAIRQLLRCLKPDGQVLLYVWALEQGTSRRGWDEGSEQDLLVPWVLKNNQPKTQKQQQHQKEGSSQRNQAENASTGSTGMSRSPPTLGAPPPAEPVATAPGQSDPVFQRYYHLYRKGELEEDVLAAGGVVVSSGYEKDNWWVVAANEGVHHAG